MREPRRTFEQDLQDLRLACGELARVLWAGYKEFLLKIGECIVKVMDWMND